MITVFSCCRGYGSHRVPGRCGVARCPHTALCQRGRWWQEKAAVGGSRCAPRHCWDCETFREHHHHQRSRWAIWDHKELRLRTNFYICWIMDLSILFSSQQHLLVPSAGLHLQQKGWCGQHPSQQRDHWRWTHPGDLLHAGPHGQG